MKISKKIAILGFIFIIVFGFLVYFFLLKTKQNTPSKVVPAVSPQPTYFPTSVIEPSIKPSVIPSIPAGDKTEINGVEVNNFYKNPVDRTEGNILIEDSKDYQVVFLANGEVFLLSILNSPFEQVRRKAEEDFLKVLGIDKIKACSLKVIVNTPISANPDESGINYPLSFCSK